MPDEQRTATEHLMGEVLPIDRPKRLLVVDRTKIEVTAWPRFRTADVLIGANTPIVYTMGYRNLLRLRESVAAAVAEFEQPNDQG